MSSGARRRFGIALVVGVLAAVAAVPAAPGTAVDAPRTSLRSADGIEGPLLASINRERRERGLKPLRLSPQLARAANSHARAMGRNGFFSHSSQDGSSATSRILRFYRVAGSGSWMVGETLLWRSPDVAPGEALAMWLGSAAHKKILMTPGFRDIGLGAVHVVNAPGTYGGRDVTIVVADFGVR
jgi:uncharacterized protein YkwD